MFSTICFLLVNAQLLHELMVAYTISVEILEGLKGQGRFRRVGRACHDPSTMPN
jgi:hypothetical protein